MRITAFIENPSGSTIKHVYDEETLELLGTTEASRAYPYAYGFLPGTHAPDGDSVDCFVLTRSSLPSGHQVACTSIALLEQIEDGEIDHNVLAVPEGEPAPDLMEVVQTLRDFIHHVFDHIPGKEMQVGRLLGPAEAIAYIRAHVGETVPDASS